MFMRKLGAIVAAAAVSLTLFAGSAFAEETPPEWEAPLRAKMETIVQIRTEADGLQAQLKQQGEANKLLRDQLVEAIVGPAAEEMKALQAELKAAYDATVAPLKAQWEPLEAQLKAAKEAKDLEEIMVLRASMAELRLQMAAEVAKLQPLRDQLAPLKEQAQAKKAELDALQAQVQPIRDQEAALHASSQALGDQAKAAMTGVEEAMKAGNWEGMLSGLDTVISLKQQQLPMYGQLEGLKTQIGTILQAALDAHK